MIIKPYFVYFLLFIAVVEVSAQNAPAPLKLIEFTLTPDAADWNYKIGQPASVQVTVLRFGVPVKNVSVSYEIGPEMLTAEKKGTLTFANGKGTIDVGTSKQPGFRQLVVRTEYQGKSYSDMVKVGYEPEKIRPTVMMPDDFLTFWKNAMAEAAKIPMDVIMTPLPQYSTKTVDVFLVNLQNHKRGKRIYGYLCKPKAAGKYPVMLNPPGAGVKSTLPYTAHADLGYITLTIEVHGVSPMLDSEAYRNINSLIGDYPQIRLEDRDNYYYKSVYLGCVRSIDFLCSLPEWDQKNVLVTGGSQGGALSIITAALSNRVTRLASFYPALSDLTGYLHGRAGGWPHLLSERNQAMNNTPERLRTIGYYDVVNFAKQIKVPGFYSWGYNDDTCPPTAVFAAINSISAPKTISITPISGHWRFEETNQESLAWFKSQLIK